MKEFTKMPRYFILFGLFLTILNAWEFHENHQLGYRVNTSNIFAGIALFLLGLYFSLGRKSKPGAILFTVIVIFALTMELILINTIAYATTLTFLVMFISYISYLAVGIYLIFHPKNI